jgi:hypothetical protein
MEVGGSFLFLVNKSALADLLRRIPVTVAFF